MKKYRFIQLITGFHRIHDVKWSFGFKIPFVKWGYFKNHGFQRLRIIKDAHGNPMKSYHNCTLTDFY